MKTTVEKAYAKINLFLEVFPGRGDGYHNIETIMQTISLKDDVVISVSQTGEKNRIECKGLSGRVPNGAANTAYVAAEKFLERSGLQGIYVKIGIRKRIPSGAGLGGGSSDAAAVIRGLNRLLDAGLSTGDMEKIGEEVGSDVPFCITGGTKLCRGRGEDMVSVHPLPKCEILIVKGRRGISTRIAYSELDKKGYNDIRGSTGMVKALEDDNIFKVTDNLYNAFEEMNPFPLRIKKYLQDHGANGALMTGSGSAVFGIYDNWKKAGLLCGQLRKKGYFAVTTKPN